MSISVSAINYDKDYVQTTRNTEAYFVKCLAKIDELRSEIDEEVKLMVELKKQIRDTIMQVTNTDEKMVLVYQYIQNHTWEQIGETLHADARTIRRWHGKAIQKVVLPENPIVI